MPPDLPWARQRSTRRALLFGNASDNMEGRGDLTMASIRLQDLRRRLYVKAKADKDWRCHAAGASAGSGGVRRGSIRPLGSSRTTGCNTRSVSERAPSPIGRITLGTKPAGERRTGNLYAPFERAGAGDGRFAYRASPRPYRRRGRGAVRWRTAN